MVLIILSDESIRLVVEIILSEHGAHEHNSYSGEDQLFDFFFVGTHGLGFSLGH